MRNVPWTEFTSVLISSRVCEKWSTSRCLLKALLIDHISLATLICNTDAVHRGSMDSWNWDNSSIERSAITSGSAIHRRACQRVDWGNGTISWRTLKGDCRFKWLHLWTLFKVSGSAVFQMFWNPKFLATSEIFFISSHVVVAVNQDGPADKFL